MGAPSRARGHAVDAASAKVKSGASQALGAFAPSNSRYLRRGGGGEKRPGIGAVLGYTLR